MLFSIEAFDNVPKHPRMSLPVQLMRENEQADDFGHLVLALVYCRMKRMLYFWRGWPCRSGEFLGPQGQSVLNELREDYKMYELYKNSKDPQYQAFDVPQQLR